MFLFYVGPIPWPMQDSASIGLYVLLCLALFNISYAITSPRLSTALKSTNFSVPNRTQYILIFSYFFLVAIGNYFATDRWMFDPTAYTGDLGDIYDQYQEGHRERGGAVSAFQLPFTFIRMLVFPFIVMIFVTNVGKNPIKVAMIAVIFLTSSAFRGTDKEIFDLALLLLVCFWYKSLFTRNIWLFAPLVIGAFILFAERRVGRFGGSLPACLPDGISCFNFQSNLAGISETLEVLYVFVTAYLTQGYNALGMTFGMDPSWQFGLGHLPPVQVIGCRIAGLMCDANNYQYQLELAGWDPSQNWTSVYPILANDLTFYGVPLYFALLGFMFKLFEACWKREKNLGALCGIVMILQFMLFSSANMQVAASLDWSLAFVVFFYLPIFTLFRPINGAR